MSAPFLENTLHPNVLQKGLSFLLEIVRVTRSLRRGNTRTPCGLCDPLPLSLFLGGGTFVEKRRTQGAVTENYQNAVAAKFLSSMSILVVLSI